MAAHQQVGHESSRDLGLDHEIPAAVGQGAPELMDLSADVGRHFSCAFAAHRTEAGAIHRPTLIVPRGERRIRQ